MDIILRNFISLDIDVDVCDDLYESCYVSFCGPVELTSVGESVFSKILDKPIDVNEDYGCAVFHVENGKELNLYKMFFYGAAGYCSEKHYHELFVD